MKGRCQRLIYKGKYLVARPERCKNYGYKKLGPVVLCYVHYKYKKSGTCPTSGG